MHGHVQANVDWALCVCGGGGGWGGGAQVVVNASALLLVAGRVRTLAEGVPVARAAIASGRAASVLRAYVQASQPAAAAAPLSTT
jgi:anthranilate phosphoribosyltransferase